MDSYQKANELFVDEDYEAALDAYTEAINETGNKNPEYFVKRAACYMKLGKFLNALQDANLAIELDPKNANAYIRKGNAYFEQQEYESAKAAFEKALSLSDQPTTRRWIRKCDAEIEADRSNDDIPQKSESKVNTPNQSTPATINNPHPIPSLSSEVDSSLQPIPSTKIRHEWYQTQSHIVITIFAKNVKQEQADIQPTEESLSVSINLPESSEFVLELSLCDKIDPSNVTVNYYATKLEIKLPKTRPTRWLTLERPAQETPIKTVAWDDASQVDKHNYPTSSKIKKNWDLIAKEVEEDKLEGDQALNKVFQDIFSRGSEDQRRAMMKSFVESGGTVLSTNWDDVGSRYVAGTPPKGVEMHKWEEINH